MAHITAALADRPDPLADIAALIRVAAESSDPAAVRAAEALDRWRRSRTETLEEALGSAPGLRAAAALRNRDEAIRALAGRIEEETPCYEKHSRRAFAAATYRKLREYRLTRWQLDRRDGRRPDGIAGLCHDIMQHCIDNYHPKEEQIRNIIGAGSSVVNQEPAGYPENPQPI
jgi:hypothetical protein